MEVGEVRRQAVQALLELEAGAEDLLAGDNNLVVALNRSNGGGRWRRRRLRAPRGAPRATAVRRRFGPAAPPRCCAL